MFWDLTFVDIVDELWWFIMVLVVCGIDMAHICCPHLFFVCSATEGEIASDIHLKQKPVDVIVRSFMIIFFVTEKTIPH